jgi:hypothetical protein
MKLYDKWPKALQSLLHLWTAKFKNLKGIEDKLVDGNIRCMWLTHNLSTKLDMHADHCRPNTTELTMNGSNGSPSLMSIPWINFYNMILSNA